MMRKRMLRLIRRQQQQQSRHYFVEQESDEDEQDAHDDDDDVDDDDESDELEQRRQRQLQHRDPQQRDPGVRTKVERRPRPSSLHIQNVSPKHASDNFDSKDASFVDDTNLDEKDVQDGQLSGGHRVPATSKPLSDTDDQGLLTPQCRIVCLVLILFCLINWNSRPATPLLVSDVVRKRTNSSHKDPAHRDNGTWIPPPYLGINISNVAEITTTLASTKTTISTVSTNLPPQVPRPPTTQSPLVDQWDQQGDVGISSPHQSAVSPSSLIGAVSWDSLVNMSRSTSSLWSAQNLQEVVHTHSCRLEYPTNSGQLVSVTFPAVPNMLIVGAQKAGTSALTRTLNKHPHTANTIQHEGHFWDFVRLRTDRVSALYQSQPDTNRFYIHHQGRSMHNMTTENWCRVRLLYSAKWDWPKMQRNAEKLATSKDPTAGKHLVAVEKTPTYISMTAVPAWIYASSMALAATPQLKPPQILFMLRNPIDRAYSAYKMERRSKQAFPAFEELLQQEWQWLFEAGWTRAPSPTSYFRDRTLANENVEAAFALPTDWVSIQDGWRGEDARRAPLRVELSSLARGMYAAQIQHWQHYFGNSHESMRILLNDVMLESTASLQQQQVLLDDIYNWLHLSTTHRLRPIEIEPEPDLRRKHDGSAGSLSMDTVTREYLQHFYRPYNAALAELLPSPGDAQRVLSWQ